MGITKDCCDGNTDDVTREIENFHDAVKVVGRWRYEENCFNGEIDEISNEINIG